MSIHISHLVPEALGDADDQVVDNGADGAEGSDILAVAVVELDVDEVFSGVREGDCEMAEILGELAARALDGHNARLDVDFDCMRMDSLALKLAPELVRSCVQSSELGVHIPPSGISSSSFEWMYSILGDWGMLQRRWSKSSSRVSSAS